MVINNKGEVMAVKITAGNTDDREPFDTMTAALEGRIVGNNGYISNSISSRNIWKRSLHLITGIRGNMKNFLMPLLYKRLLRSNYSETPVPIDSSRERDRKGFLYLSVTCQPMGRANNERQCCSSKAQHIFHSVVDIM